MYSNSNVTSALVAFKIIYAKWLNIKTLARKRQKHLDWLIFKISSLRS